MAIFDEIGAGLKDALKAKDSVRLAALRSIRAAFINEMKKDNSDSLTDEACIALLRKREKQGLESIEAFEKGDRPDQAAAEQAELVVVRAFLPALADESQTTAWVEEAIASSGAESAQDLGKVMGALMKAHKGDVDGNLARSIAAAKLAGGLDPIL